VKRRGNLIGIASGYRPRNDGEVGFQNLSREESKILFTGFGHLFIWSFI
jgi:hypothetical protein